MLRLSEMWHPQWKYSFEAFSNILKHRIDTWFNKFCRAHQTVSSTVWSDSVNELQWWRKFSDWTRAERKIDEKWRQRSVFDLGYLQVVHVSELCPNDYPMQNWMRYNLMLSFPWKSLVQEKRSQNLGEIPFSKFDLSQPSRNFIPEVKLWTKLF